MPDRSKLEEALMKAVDEFQGNTQAYCGALKRDCTSEDLEELGKYTFYALNDFKKAIIEYLK
ncbi:MAG TPA: hypothetical protein DDW65_00995 [Firmicutes bacterium]|jgi:hypothetical protein|nr:hypothetical protein [Bacillota bacterium]